MLQKMRDNAQGTAAKILLGLLVIVFTIFGFGAFEAFVDSEPPAAKVNGEKISRVALESEVERQRLRMLAQMGQNANPDLIDTARLQKSVLDGLINRKLILETAGAMGLRVSEADVDRAIMDNPQFRVNNKFDPELYKRLIANAGQTTLGFKEEMTNNITLVQLNGAMTETPFLTDQEARDIARLLTQKRDFAYLVFAPDKYKAEVTVTDDAVASYYQSHLPDFMTDDVVDVDYVQLSLAELARAKEFEPNEEQVVAQYDTDRKTFEPAEQRHIEHILLQVNATRTEDAAREQLSAIRERLTKGEKFEDIARAVSEDPGSAVSGGDLGFVARGALVPEFEQAAWALAPNQISEPVRTEFGVHLIKVIEIKTDEYASLDAMRPEITERLRRQAADEKYRTKIRELDELAFESPDGLDQLAQSSSLTVQHVKDITQNAGAAPFDHAELRTAAFADDVLARGLNSRVIEVDGTAYVLRVAEHRPPSQRELADVSSGIRDLLIAEAAANRARQLVDEALARVAAGEGSATVAGAYGLEWKIASGATRTTPGYEREVIDAAFELPRPTTDARSVTSANLGDGKMAVVTVTAVNDGDFGALTEQDRTAIRSQLARRMGVEEFEALFKTVRDSASIDRI
jgi:peptidyl-prolyl cis-trans isomerase D